MSSDGVKDTSLKAKDSTLKAKAEAKDSTLKAKIKLSSRILEDEDLSSRTPTLKHRIKCFGEAPILYTFTQCSVTDRILSCCP